MNGFAVADSSALVALLLDDGAPGEWAAAALRGQILAAPHLVFFEAANVIRRQAAARLVTDDSAAQALGDLLDLGIECWPYWPLAARSWELRNSLTVHDASYVALAELLGATLVTLDERIGRAPSLRCAVSTPPEH